jgi:hypothetical protein
MKERRHRRDQRKRTQLIQELEKQERIARATTLKPLAVAIRRAVLRTPQGKK